MYWVLNALVAIVAFPKSFKKAERGVCNLVKSRQGKHQTVKSSLNVIREICVLLFTAMFWLYCCTAIIVIGGSLLHINVETVLMIRTVLNIEIDDINYLLNS